MNGFTPSILGLPDPINHPYGEPRLSGCPHSGIDIATRNPVNGELIAKPFTAGIFGQIYLIPNSKWNTIQVMPFHNPACIVQYLHASEIQVENNQVVAPWTPLGLTGETGPPGRVDGIHLHLQVIDPTDHGPFPTCWSRNYVDPVKWKILDPMTGHWLLTKHLGTQDNAGNQISEHREYSLNISDSEIGSRVNLHIRQTFVWVADGCTIVCDHDYLDISVVKHISNGIVIDGSSSNNTSCSTAVNCRVNNRAPFNFIESTLILKSPHHLEFKLANGTTFVFHKSNRQVASILPIKPSCSGKSEKEPNLLMQQENTLFQ